MKYESATNRRLHDPSRAYELAVDAVHHVRATVSDAAADASAYRVVLGLGPGRSGTKSLTELLAAQAGCVHAEHEMVVRRRYRRDESGRVDPRNVFAQQQNNNKKDNKKTKTTNTNNPPPCLKEAKHSEGTEGRAASAASDLRERAAL